MYENRMAYLLAVVAVLAMTAASANAEIIFSDNFENPDVGGGPFGTFNGVPRVSNTRDTTTWIGASQGFGATQNGLLDESSGAFTDPTGSQAYGFRYTNSGVTTAEGVIGSFIAGDYALSFDVVQDTGQTGTFYRAELVAFDLGDNNAARTEHRGARPGTILDFVTGNAPGDGSYLNVLLNYTVLDTDAAIGKDIGVRFIGATSSAFIDNVALDAPSITAVPEPGSFAVWSLIVLSLVGFGYRNLRCKKFKKACA